MSDTLCAFKERSSALRSIERQQGGLRLSSLWGGGEQFYLEVEELEGAQAELEPWKRDFGSPLVIEVSGGGSVHACTLRLQHRQQHNVVLRRFSSCLGADPRKTKCECLMGPVLHPLEVQSHTAISCR